MSGIPAGEYKELVKALGETLVVKGFDDPGTDGQVIRRHVAELDSLPKMLLAKLRREGLREIMVGPGSVPDFPGFELLSNRPVPSRRDLTWDEVDGAYFESSKVVLLGTYPEPACGAATHEIAHALGDILGYYDDFRVWKAYRNTTRVLAERMPKAEVPGIQIPKEFFANSLVYVTIYPQEAEELLGNDYMNFIREIVFRGRAARTK